MHTHDPASLAKTISWYQHGMDFADALHLANSQQATQFYQKFLAG